MRIDLSKKKYLQEDFEKPVKPENELTLVYKELNTLRSWREVNRNPLNYKKFRACVGCALGRGLERARSSTT